MPLDLLQSVRNRAAAGIPSGGIGTADFYLRAFDECLGGSCPSQYFKDVSPFRWRKGLEAAAKRLVYHHPEMEVDGDEFYAGDALKAAAPKFGELPPHTIAALNATITTTRQDRDGDILDTAGATLDPKAPLLYQHMQFENCGRLLQEGKHTGKLLTGSFALCGTPLGEDCAMLAEHGALRISHGFTVDDYEPIENEAGIHVLKFQILEVSLVSIPSNPDAEITAFSRDKLHHPLVKALAAAKYASRPVVASVPIDVAQLTSSLSAGTSVTFTKAAAQAGEESCDCKSHDAKTLATKSVVPYKRTPADDSKTWDADAAVKGLRSWAGVDGDEPEKSAFSKYEQGFGIVDGEAENLTSYKYPHHEADGGKLTVNRKACAAVIAALNGGRGGTDLSESDRKGLYEHIARHYRDSFPEEDVPELKCAKPLRYKGVYVEFENSFDDIRQDLNDALLPFLISTGDADASDFCYIVDLFLYQALVQVRDAAGLYGTINDEDCTYFLIDWEMGANEEPVWSGAPQAVAITPQITALDKRAFAMFVKSLPAKHVRSLKKAMGHLDAAAEHEDATKPVKTLAAKAHAAVAEVHEAHAKGVGLSDEHAGLLKKAMGFCSAGADHDEAVEPVAKSFQSAHGLIKSVADAADMGGEESLESLVEKTGRKLSAANAAKLKSAAANFKAIADDDEAHKSVADLATKGYSAVKSIFASGGDSGSDYDADGNYTAGDMNAYTTEGDSANDGGKSSQPGGEKAGRAVSKRTEATIREAIGHGQGVIAHEKATADHKSLARKSVAKLRGVIGDKTPGDASSDDAGGEDDPDGAMGYHGGNPQANGGQADSGKSFVEECEKAFDEAVLTYTIFGAFEELDQFEGFAKRALDTTSRIWKQRQFQADEKLVNDALAAV